MMRPEVASSSRNPVLLALFAVLLLIAQLGSPRAIASPDRPGPDLPDLDVPGFDVPGLDVPGFTGPVLDKANLLDPDQEARLVGRLQHYGAASSNHVIVVTLPSLQGGAIGDYAVEFGRRWIDGRDDRNNSVLLLVVSDERQAWIEVGGGLKSQLPDATAKVIIEQYILPFIRKGDYPYGIAIGVDSVLGAIEGTFSPPSASPPSASPPSAEPQPEDSSVLSSPFIYLLLIFAIGLLYWLKDRFGVPEVDSHHGDDWRRGGSSGIW